MQRFSILYEDLDRWQTHRVKSVPDNIFVVHYRIADLVSRCGNDNALSKAILALDVLDKDRVSRKKVLENGINMVL